MIGAFWALVLTHNPSLSAMRTPPLRMAEKAGAWRGEYDAPPTGRGGRGSSHQRRTGLPQAPPIDSAARCQSIMHGKR